LQKKTKKIIKSNTTSNGYARQQTSAQFQALDQDEDYGFRALYLQKIKIKKSQNLTLPVPAV
jgi:hypothetical protein